MSSSGVVTALCIHAYMDGRMNENAMDFRFQNLQGERYIYGDFCCWSKMGLYMTSITGVKLECLMTSNSLSTLRLVSSLADAYDQLQL